MNTPEKHAVRTWRRLQRRGEHGELRLTYASARTARKAEAAMLRLGVPVEVTWHGHRTLDYARTDQ